MPRLELISTNIDRTGTTPPAEVVASVVDNHYFVNDGRVFLQVRNNGAGAVAVTIEIPGEYDSGIANPDRVVSIPAAATRLIGPFPPSYNQPGSALVNVNPATADLRFILYRLP